MLKKLVLVGYTTVVMTTLANAQQFYGNGYTIVSGTPKQTQSDATLNFKVYKTIKSKRVYNALLELLKGSGWQLADKINADPAINRLYRQNYPDYKRTLHPISLGDALSYIAGDSWDLVVDPVNHLVSFQLSEKYRCFTLKEASCPHKK